MEHKFTDRQVPQVRGYITRNLSFEDEYRFIFYCPYCRDWHVHGIKGKLFDMTTGKPVLYKNIHRSSHCSYKDSPYRDTGYWLRPFSMKELDMIRKDERFLTSLGDNDKI